MDRGKKKGGCLKVGLWVLVGLIVVLAALYIIGITVGGADPISGAQTTPTGQTEQQTPTEPAAQPTGNILLDAEVQVADVMTGDGSEKIGEYAYITITKDQAQALTEDEFIAFLNERVNGCGYNWFTVVLDDGTGVAYSGGSTLAGTYGQLAADKTVEKELGYITFDGEKVTYEKAE